MVLQNEDQQQSLVDRRNSTDSLDIEGASVYSTFPSDAETDRLVKDVSGDDTTKSEEREYTWTAIAMVMSTWIGLFLASVDVSVMATLTGPISESFSAFHLMTWFINAYTVSSALIQPLSGKLSDIYGRRNCLLWANIAFLLGNLICGLAVEPWHFVLGRALGGLGGGCLNSIATFVASDVIPLRARGFWQGLSNITFGAGFALGGVLGGIIHSSVGWEWAFLFQPPAILVSMVLVYYLIPNIKLGHYSGRSSVKRIDFLGSATLTFAILCLMFGAVSGGNILPWSSLPVYGSLALCPCFLLIFTYVEVKIAKEPIIPVRLLANRTTMGSCLASLLCTTANTALIFYLPMLMETRGLSPADAGLRLIPNAAGMFVGSVAIGALISKIGKYYWCCMFAHALLVISSFVTLLNLEHAESWYSYILFFMNGSGFGGMLVTTLLALISAASHEQHAVLTSASYAFRSVGNTLGTTIAGALFQNIFASDLWMQFQNDPDAAYLIPAIRRRELDLKDLSPDLRSGVSKSYDHAFRAVFAFIFGTYVFGTLTASFIRENRLHLKVDRK